MQAQNHASHFATRVRQILTGPAATKPQLFTQSWSSAVLLMPLLLLALGLFAPAAQAEKKIPEPKVKPTFVLPEKPKTAATKTTTKPLVKDPETISPTTVVENPPPSITTGTIDSLPQSSNDAVLSVAADRMNVLYMGIDNPIRVAISGVPADQVKVSSRDVRLIETGKGKFIAKPDRPGRATILVEAPNYRQEVEFRVKPIPDPVAVLENSGAMSGEIYLSTFRSLTGIEPKLFGFDMDAQCKILGFSVIYIGKSENPLQAVNPGGLFTPQVLELITNAKVGGQVIFDNIRAKCPGDESGRKINNMAFKIIADPEKKE